MKTAIFLLTIFTINSDFCLAVDIVSGENIRSWVEITPLKPQSDEMQCANRGDVGEWSVSVRDGKIHVHHYKSTVLAGDPLPFTIPKRPIFNGSRSVLKTDDGFLVGFDAGEWGGGLWWFSGNGADSYNISGENIIKLVDIDGTPIAIVGLAHLILNYGAVEELARYPKAKAEWFIRPPGINSGDAPAPTAGIREKDKKKWSIKRSFSLDSAPYITTPDNKGGLLIITDKGLSRYYKGAIKLLHSSYYEPLYPNSIAISPKDIIFIGMRYAIVKLTPNSGGYTESWLVPATCAILDKNECECRSVPEKVEH